MPRLIVSRWDELIPNRLITLGRLTRSQHKCSLCSNMFLIAYIIIYLYRIPSNQSYAISPFSSCSCTGAHHAYIYIWLYIYCHPAYKYIYIYVFTYQLRTLYVLYTFLVVHTLRISISMTFRPRSKYPEVGWQGYCQVNCKVSVPFWGIKALLRVRIPFF